ncbi:MAG: hypothetical protein SVM80_04040 [Halobacteriota archaeon]|nr:hypothetical protein [Halobacteriota archaeon]
MTGKRHLEYNLDLLIPYFLRIVSLLLLAVAFYRRDMLGIIACIITVVISFIPTILKRDFKITLPWSLDLLMASALLLHVGGYIFGVYNLIPGYDTITHFFSSIFVSFMAFVIIYILDEYWEGLRMDTYAMGFVVIIFTMAMGAVWELFEWAVDSLFGIDLQWGLQDTMMDLLVDSIAGVIMGIVGVSLIKRGKLKEITKDFGEQVDHTLIHPEGESAEKIR